LIALKNENAIARSIRNIVFTLPGEKFFNENFGSKFQELFLKMLMTFLHQLLLMKLEIYYKL
jgi:phage baseplate assembly protein W